MNKIMYSKPLVDQKLEDLKATIDKFEKKPSLLVIQVGNDEASSVYIKSKRKACEKVGMIFSHIKLKSSSTTNELVKVIEKANQDKTINGILVQLPLPKHIDKDIVINRISPEKDVDGLTIQNIGKLAAGLKGLTPCTPKGIINLMKFYNINLEGKNIVILGRSNLVGKPIANLLLKENATITICHSKTKKLKNITTKADILICAIGEKHFINKKYIKKDAILIDVGITKEDGKLYGDINYNNVFKKCKLITPVPKGVGPMTVVTLLENVLYAYKKSK